MKIVFREILQQKQLKILREILDLAFAYDFFVAGSEKTHKSEDFLSEKLWKLVASSQTRRCTAITSDE
jgi:hypothetical protein